MTESLAKQAEQLIEMALIEDLGDRGDITSAAISESSGVCKGIILAKAEGTIAGLDIASRVMKRVDAATECTPLVRDGVHVSKGQILMRLAGDSSKILIAERTALNFLGRLSGIATLTRHFVEAVAGTQARILDTRKTTPGWRALEKYAVRCGGGLNHRMGLYDMFLIKDNHIIAAGGITAAVEHCRSFMQHQGFAAEIEVETRTLADVKEAAGLRVDRIMLDNMTTDHIRQAVEWVKGRIPLEASGNVTLETVTTIARTGVDYISSGSLTHSARILDISLDLL